MKCQTCPDYKGNVCMKATEGKLGDLDSECISRVQCILLRDILEEMRIMNEAEEEGDEWKYNL